MGRTWEASIGEEVLELFIEVKASNEEGIRKSTTAGA